MVVVVWDRLVVVVVVLELLVVVVVVWDRVVVNKGVDGVREGSRKAERVYDCSYTRSGNLESQKKRNVSRTHVRLLVRVFGAVKRVMGGGETHLK
jgi:hypothetical protein